jgi:HSP20 family molecular chaperone IbpA
MTGQDLEVQQKREVQSKEEATVPSRVFLPTTDIFETDQALTVVMEMPGVNKDKVEINLEDGVLTIEGKIDFSKYQDLQPVYTEYNIGNYRRSFTLPETIDQEKIKAEMSDGVLC